MHTHARASSDAKVSTPKHTSNVLMSVVPVALTPPSSMLLLLRVPGTASLASFFTPSSLDSPPSLTSRVSPWHPLARLGVAHRLGRGCSSGQQISSVPGRSCLGWGFRQSWFQVPRSKFHEPEAQGILRYHRLTDLSSPWSQPAASIPLPCSLLDREEAHHTPNRPTSIQAQSSVLTTPGSPISALDMR